MNWTLTRGKCTMLVGIALAFSLPNIATADVLSDSANITMDGQTFIFSFSDVGLSDGTDGMLTIEALGDYSATPPSSEVLDIDIDGIFVDFAFDPSRGATIGNDLFQNDAFQSYVVPGADLLAITGDASVMMTLQNAASVGFFSDQPEDFVRATLTYAAIPEPTTVLPLLIGAILMLTHRRSR